MAELENLLLEAAGRTGTSKRKNQSHSHSRWRREDSETESKEHDSENSKIKRRRHSGSRIPPTNSHGASQEKEEMRNWVNGNDNRFSGDESDSTASLGSDLYIDDEDKEELNKLSEFQRELILAERSSKIDEFRLKKRAKVYAEVVKYGKESPPPNLPHSRPSAETEKTDAPSKLRAKRMRQRRNSVGFTSYSSGYKNFLPIVELHSSESEDGKGGKFPADIDTDDNLDDLSTSKTRPIRYEDAKEITFRRSKLAKWLMEPFFEEIVTGCFVRIGIGRTRTGPKYRLCVVKNVDATDLNRQYKLEGRNTCKYLNCIWGSEATAARWQMAMVSDSPPTEEEFNEWFSEMERSGSHIPSLQDVEDKKEMIQKTNTFVYSPKTVKTMVEEKKSSSSKPLNFAVEKLLLKEQIEGAEISGKEAEAERLKTKLKKVEELSRQVKPGYERALKLLEMNHKNKVENYKKASGLKPAPVNLRAGQVGYDRCARKWTRPMGTVLEPVREEEIDEETAWAWELGKVTVSAAMEEAGREGKLIDTIAPVDHGQEMSLLHDFDLPISLATLNKFRGADGIQLAFMARKQKIEATVGYKVPDNYGRRHVLALSISDYKRRRGLV